MADCPCGCEKVARGMGQPSQQGETPGRGAQGHGPAAQARPVQVQGIRLNVLPVRITDETWIIDFCQS